MRRIVKNNTKKKITKKLQKPKFSTQKNSNNSNNSNLFFFRVVRKLHTCISNFLRASREKRDYFF